MAMTLSFETLHKYDPGEAGIPIPIILTIGQARASLSAKLDTASTYCVFEREIGEDLGLDIESGIPELIGTATGRFKAYGHDLTLLMLGFQLDVTAYFAEQYGFGRNVLGRRTWLQQLKIGVVDYDGLLFLDSYDGKP